MKNKQTGAIEKWFGTCTDIHEAVESRFVAERMVRILPYLRSGSICRSWLIIMSRANNCYLSLPIRK